MRDKGTGSPVKSIPAVVMKTATRSAIAQLYIN